MCVCVCAVGLQNVTGGASAFRNVTMQQKPLSIDGVSHHITNGIRFWTDSNVHSIATYTLLQCRVIPFEMGQFEETFPGDHLQFG